jgi:hypothetical protein
MKLPLSLILLMFILSNGYTQTFKEASESIEGISMPMLYGNTNILYTGKNESVFLSGRESIEKAITGTLVKINSDRKILWSTERIDGFIGATMFLNNIIAFSSEDWQKNTFNFIKAIHARFIDVVTGKTILEKDIYKISDKLFVQPFVYSDMNGNFQYLQIRYTKRDKYFDFRDADFKGTTKIVLLSIDQGLNTKAVTLNMPNMNEATYISGTTNNQGDLFIGSYTSNAVIIDKYKNMEPDAVATLQTKFLLQESKSYDAKIKNNGKSGNQFVFIMAPSTQEIKTVFSALFDFDTKQVYVDKTKGLQLPLTKDGSLILVGALNYKDKILVLSEQRNTRMVTYPSGDRGEQYSSGELHVSFCDSNFKVVKDIILKKIAQFNLNIGMAPGYKIFENKLLIVSNTMPHALDIDLRYAIINLDDFSMVEGSFNNNKKGTNAIVGSQTLWFGKTALVPMAIDRSFTSSRKFDTVFQEIEF